MIMTSREVWIVYYPSWFIYLYLIYDISMHGWSNKTEMKVISLDPLYRPISQNQIFYFMILLPKYLFSLKSSSNGKITQFLRQNHNVKVISEKCFLKFPKFLKIFFSYWKFWNLKLDIFLRNNLSLPPMISQVHICKKIY